MKQSKHARLKPSTRQGGKPRNGVDLPLAVKLGVGIVILGLLGVFFGRVVINERALSADLEFNPLPLAAEEVSDDPIPEEEIINHCENASPQELCRISLPAIGIPSMKLSSLGTTQRNGRTQIDVPNSIYVAGWFNGSVRPGERGVTFISAHSSAARHAPFNDLHRLRPGEEIIVERGDGSNFHYQVAAISRLTIADANVWIRSNLGARANANAGNRNILYLMTCIGAWNLNENTMNERLLVRAYLVE
ncbi:class F sortase [Candidatus Saccharibacteria bacterium]|nr:class F sortase [Candidatus Saccharibacteria bacterium]